MNGDTMISIIKTNAGRSNVPGIVSKIINNAPKVQSSNE